MTVVALTVPRTVSPIVGEVQRDLIRRGILDAGSDDNVYGPMTADAVRRLRVAFGLDVTTEIDDAFLALARRRDPGPAAHAVDRLEGWLLAQVGKRYVYGVEVTDEKTEPRAWDCSELTEGACRHLGVKLPDGARYQFAACTDIGRGTPAVGDLLFQCKGAAIEGVHHVGMLIRGLHVVEAYGTGRGVIRSDLASWMKRSDFAGIRRFAPLHTLIST